MAKNIDTKKQYDINVKDIIVAPFITEKSSYLAGDNKYVFLVTAKANKPEIKKAILNLYKVEPLSVNIVSVKGKTVRRGKVRGRKQDFRKAIVTLRKEDKIDLMQ
ncbi:MAG TPA: 50S ribosomal protein L23 [bacterium]|nr:50S ribosomal protein L23 [bacterium]